jgi:hypothetical protein
LLLLFLLFSFLVPTRSAYAYLDPVGGNYLLQLIVAGLVASSFVIKAFWRNIRDFFGALFLRRGNEGRRKTAP